MNPIIIVENEKNLYLRPCPLLIRVLLISTENTDVMSRQIIKALSWGNLELKLNYDDACAYVNINVDKII